MIPHDLASWLALFIAIASAVLGFLNRASLNGVKAQNARNDQSSRHMDGSSSRRD